MKTILIASISQNFVIGNRGKLPWDISSDILHFKLTTLNNTVLMGRKTFDSIGKLLPQRFNIILSRSKSKFISEQNNYSICRNIEDAYSCANEKKNGDLYVIGGQEVFNQTINSADELIISHIPLQVKGDAFFPAIDPKIWNEDKRISQDSFHISYYSKRN